MAITVDAAGQRMEFPDGTDPAIIERTVKNFLGVKPERSAPQEVGRQLGLSARAPLRAATGVAGMFSDPVTATVNLGARALGSDYRMPYLGEVVDRQLNKVLPTPETDVEKFSAAVAEGGFGAAAGAAIPGAVKSAGGVGAQVIKQLMANPGAQVAAGATGAGAAQLSSDLGAIPSAIIGMAAGAAGGKAYQAGGKTYDSAKNLVSRVSDINLRVETILSNADIKPGGMAPGLREEVANIVKASIDTGAPIDEAQFARWAALRNSGVPKASITKAMVTRDPMDWQAESRAGKTVEGSRIRDAYVSAEDSFNQTLRGIAPDAPADSNMGRSIRGGLEWQRDALTAQSTAAYDAVKKLPQAAQGVKVSDLRVAINAGQRASTNEGIYKVALNQLDDLSAGDTIRIDKLEQLQQKLNANWSPDNKAAIGEINGMIRDSIERTVGVDAFRPARESWQILKATTDDQTGIARLLDKKTKIDYRVPSEDIFRKTVISGPNDELKQIINELKISGNKGAVQAYRAKTIEHLANALRAGEDREVRFSSFENRLNSVREKLPTLFDAEEVKLIQDIEQAAKLVITDVNRAALNRSNTGNENRAIIAALKNSPASSIINRVTFGMGGAALDAGKQSLQSGKDRRLANALTNYKPMGQAPVDAKIIGQVLIGALLGGAASRPERPVKNQE